MGYTDRIDEGYNIRYINTDINITKLIPRLRRLKKGRFLFYGVAGSGKSLLGAYIAKELKINLFMVTGSDILARYSGESESNIRQIFEEAEERKAVLLIDEIGYFLSDRRNVSHSWEVSQTNEFLTRLELFDGIVIGTTNYELDGYIDHAFYRRFDLRVKFNYLKPAQAKNLFRDSMKRLNILPKGMSGLAPCYSELNSMTKLTPADFALAVRKAPFLYERLNPSILLNMIKEEISIKPDVEHRSIGFI